MGSVKDLEVLKSPKNDTAGIARFIFSDRYSVFDWGQMPDDIESKGKAICLIGAYFFEQLEEMGINTHYRGVVENNTLKRVSELDEPTNVLEISLLRVLKPKIDQEKYDYSLYNPTLSNILIPLEIIYRNALPAGSSVFKRIKENTLDIRSIGLDEIPTPGQVLKTPILDFSTKLESTDRYISYDETKKIAGLSDDEFEKIKTITTKINHFITESVEKVGLVNEDGKIELGFGKNRSITVVDVLGTPDECRFTLDGMPLSKEFLRLFYRNTSWAKEVDRAKKKHGIEWKSYVKSSPTPLPDNLRVLSSSIYTSFCNALTGIKFFDTDPLEEVTKRMKETF